MILPVFSAQWVQQGETWYYQQDNGSYQKNGWAEIDGIEYYFDADGKMLVDTVTPDGQGVDSTGARKKNLGVYRDKQAAFTGDTITVTATMDDWNNAASDVTWSIGRGDLVITNISADTHTITVVGKSAGEYRIKGHVKTKSGINCETECGGMILDPVTGGWLKNSNGEWTYVENGQLVKNAWRQNKGNYFYLNSDGVIAKDTTVTTDEGTFYVDKEGVRK